VGTKVPQFTSTSRPLDLHTTHLPTFCKHHYR